MNNVSKFKKLLSCMEQPLYRVKSIADEDGGGYLIEFLEFPGCIGTGSTIREAFDDADIALEAWMKERGLDGS